jgi:PDZ domain-containing protein
MTASGNYSQIAGTNGLCLEPRNGAKENGAPLDLAKCDGSKTDQLWVLKTPTRGVLGIKWRKPTDEETRSLPLEKGTGVIIEKVLQGGPAEKSGLVAGDAIATVDGRAIRTPAEMPAKPSGKATGCSRYMPSVGLTVPVPCDEY